MASPQITGVDYKFNSNAEKIKKEIEDVAHKVEDDMGAALAATVGSMAPKRTGRLSEHFSATRTDEGVIVHNERTNFYGMFVEFGTAQRPPEPFMAPALEAARGVFDAAVESAIKAVVEG